MLFGIEQPDPADSLLESLPVEGHVAEFGAVGIDGRRRAVQEAGDTAAVGDAQADCGEDAQFGGAANGVRSALREAAVRRPVR